MGTGAGADAGQPCDPLDFGDCSGICREFPTGDWTLGTYEYGEFENLGRDGVCNDGSDGGPDFSCIEFGCDGLPFLFQYRDYENIQKFLK